MDKKTGLGVSVEEYVNINGKVILDNAYEDMRKQRRASSIIECDCDDLDMLNRDFLIYGEKVAKLDDVGYGELGKFLGIPVPYLLKLPTDLKNANCQYWLTLKSGKQVKVRIAKESIVEISDAQAIDKVDVVDILNDVFKDAIILRTSQQTNSTLMDIYVPTKVYEADRKFYGGVRVLLKEGLNAPDIVPIFVDVDSCAIIECATYLVQSSIRGLSYTDVLRVIRSTCENARDSLPLLFGTYKKICDEAVPEPRRRISLYGREHGVPSRVSAYAVKQYDDMHIAGATYGDIISLFGGMGFIEEVKQASERKMQKLAGYIVVKSHGEKRCASCDSKLLEE